TEALAKYPNARMSFIGHSNGTYLLASALKLYPACTFHRVVFAGSVVPRNFYWDRFIPDRVSAIRNYVATRDWVVGIFPRFFEYFERPSKQPDLGSAGFRGFTTNSGQRYEARFVKGGHGAALDPSNFRAIARFILDGEEEPIPEKITANKQSAVIGVLSNLAFVVWAFLAAVILFALYAVVFWVHFPAPVWARFLVFIFLLISILKNVLSKTFSIDLAWKRTGFLWDRGRHGGGHWTG